MDWVFGVYCHFQQYFSYIMATSFSGGRSWSTRREPPTMGKQLVNFYHMRLRVECTLFCNLQSWAQTHAILVIGLYELLGNPIEPPGPFIVRYQMNTLSTLSDALNLNLKLPGNS